MSTDNNSFDDGTKPAKDTVSKEGEEEAEGGALPSALQSSSSQGLAALCDDSSQPGPITHPVHLNGTPMRVAAHLITQEHILNDETSSKDAAENKVKSNNDVHIGISAAPSESFAQLSQPSQRQVAPSAISGDVGDGKAVSESTDETKQNPREMEIPRGTLETEVDASKKATDVSATVSQITAAKTANGEGTVKGASAETMKMDERVANALLSLGQDIHSSKANPPLLPNLPPWSEDMNPHSRNAAGSLQEQQEGAQNNGKRKNSESEGGSQGVVRPQPERAKRAKNVDNSTSGDNPPDFWYWLQPNDKLGDWDVIAGRGGESNNAVGNKKYRNIVNQRKQEYRAIPLKQRKAKTAFVKSIVQHVNNCGGRFVDLDEKTGRYYVVTMDRARKKTSQALRETKELKWLDLEPKERKSTSNKNCVCPYCHKMGHKTKIAKDCDRHHEWVKENDIKAAEEKEAGERSETKTEDHEPSLPEPMNDLGIIKLEQTEEERRPANFKEESKNDEVDIGETLVMYTTAV